LPKHLAKKKCIFSFCTSQLCFFGKRNKTKLLCLLIFVFPTQTS